MSDEAGSRNAELAWQSELADVTGMDLPELLLSTDTVLAKSVQRIQAELAQAQEVIAGHGNGVR
jgi:hypothetical protein